MGVFAPGWVYTASFTVITFTYNKPGIVSSIGSYGNTVAVPGDSSLNKAAVVTAQLNRASEFTVDVRYPINDSRWS